MIPNRASDAGPEDNHSPVVLEECQNCRKPAETLVWIGDGWDYLACPECLAEAKAMDLAELLAETGCTAEEVYQPVMSETRPVRRQEVA
jgi:hypothetical protein